MRIDGNQMGNSPVQHMGTNGGGDDSISKGLKKQIETVQSELRSLSANKDISPEEKQERSKSLRQELSDLKQQLSQHQIEKQKEQREQKMQRAEENKAARNTAGKGKKDEAASMDASAMQGFMAADAALNQTQHAASLKKNIENSARITKTEIKLDGGRDRDTGMKQEALGKMEDKIASLDTAIKNGAQEAAEAIKPQGGAEETKESEDEDKAKTLKEKEEKEEKETGEAGRDTPYYKKINVLV